MFSVFKFGNFIEQCDVPYTSPDKFQVNDLKVNGGVWRGEQSREAATGGGVGGTLPQGWGVLTYAREDPLERREYRGNMAAGRREGRGTLTWVSGASYAGEWRGDRREGEGTMFYPNGDVYVGQWKEEKKSGQGTYMHASGSLFTIK